MSIQSRWLAMRWLMLCCVFAVSVAASATAQVQQVTPEGAPNYELWQSVASRAEATVDAAADPSDIFEALRGRLVDFRTKFAAARSVNKERIASLQTQLTALGPVPETGTEASDVASRRAELTQQLAALQAPAQVAEAAYSRADGLIREIDTIIRDRQTKRLLSLGPSPLNPVHWGPAFVDARNMVTELLAERRIWTDSDKVAAFRQAAPLILLFLVIGIVLLSRGRSWSAKLADYLRQLGGRGMGVWGFLVSLFRIILPLLGVYALTIAVLSSEMLGLRGVRIVESIPQWALWLLGTRWLSERLFSRQDDEALLNLSQEQRSEARFYVSILALVVVLRDGLALGLEFDVEFGQSADAATTAVFAFPLVVVCGVLLFRLGQILTHASKAGTTPEVSPSVEVRVTTFSRVLRLIGLGVMAVAVIGPVMAAVGYAQAGDAMVYPAVASLAVLGTVMVSQRFFADVYGWISGLGMAGREALVPVLTSFVLLMLSVPILALIWGARVADLTEMWTAFSQGFTLGEARISPVDFLTFVLIFSVGYLLTRLLQGALRNNVLPKTRIDLGGQNAIVSGLGYIGIFLAALIAISGLALICRRWRLSLGPCRSASVLVCKTSCPTLCRASSC